MNTLSSDLINHIGSFLDQNAIQALLCVLKKDYYFPHIQSLNIAINRTSELKNLQYLPKYYKSLKGVNLRISNNCVKDSDCEVLPYLSFKVWLDIRHTHLYAPILNMFQATPFSLECRAGQIPVSFNPRSENPTNP